MESGLVKFGSWCFFNGPQLLLGEFEQIILLKYIMEDPTAYLHEIQRKLLGAYGVQVSASTICCTLKAMGCSRQVMRHVALQQSDTLHAKFMAEVSLYEPGMLIWLDESGSDSEIAFVNMVTAFEEFVL